MSETPYKEMGERLEVARKSTNMTQSAMTKLLGLSPSAYGHYERGARRMPPHIMAQFVELTGYSSDWLYLGVGSQKKDDEIPSKIENYVQRMKEFDEKEQEQFDSMWQTFFEKK